MLSTIKKLKTILREYLFAIPAPHPLYIATSAFIWGACYAHTHAIGIILFACIAIGLAIHHSAQHKKYISLFLLIFIGFEFGFFRAKYQIEKFQNMQQSCAQGPFKIILHVKDYKKLYGKMSSCCITGIILDAQQCTTGNKCPELKGATVQLFCTTQQHCAIQDVVALDDISFSQQGPFAPFALYLIRSGISATAHCNNTISVQQIATTDSYLCVEQLQQTIVERIGAKLHGYTATLFNSIFLGYKDAAQSRLSVIKQQFRLWGIEHYLARSGLHMALLALLWMYLISLIPIGLSHKHIIILCCACIYALYTIPSISFMRTFLFFCSYKLLAIADAPVHNMHLFSMIMLCVLIYNPIHLFFLDFQLSFILAGSLVWIHAIMRQKKQALA